MAAVWKIILKNIKLRMCLDKAFKLCVDDTLLLCIRFFPKSFFLFLSLSPSPSLAAWALCSTYHSIILPWSAFVWFSTQPTTQKAIHTFQSQSVHNFCRNWWLIRYLVELLRVLQKASVKKDYKALVLLKLRYFYHRKCFLVAKRWVLDSRAIFQHKYFAILIGNIFFFQLH